MGVVEGNRLWTMVVVFAERHCEGCLTAFQVGQRQMTMRKVETGG